MSETVAYLDQHPPIRSQSHSPRRQTLIGVIGVHTTEGVLDGIGPDLGAENTAGYITTRTTPGSYNDIVDRDSWVHVVDYDTEAFHIATHTFNRRTTGLAFACRTVDWARMSPSTREWFLRNGARAAAAQARYVKAKTGIVIPARRISLAEALREVPGFLAHGDADPDRRTDPGIRPPDLFPWDEFFTYYRDYAADVLGITPTKPNPIEEITMDVKTEIIQAIKDQLGGVNLAALLEVKERNITFLVDPKTKKRWVTNLFEVRPIEESWINKIKAASGTFQATSLDVTLADVEAGVYGRLVTE